jgi:hypothetical protein
MTPDEHQLVVNMLAKQFHYSEHREHHYHVVALLFLHKPKQVEGTSGGRQN